MIFILYRLLPLLLLVVVFFCSSSLVQARSYGDKSSSTSGDDDSEDGGAVQAGRLGTTTTTNRAAKCEQCTNIGGWRCDNIRGKNTPWCYQSSNRKLKKWIRRGFCLQKCAELGLPHPAHRNCCTSAHEAEDDSKTGGDNEDNGVDSTPRADTCAQCTDKVSRGMAKRGIACNDIGDLGKRCLRYQRWVSQGWTDWDLCRKTCSDIGYPYPDQTCCGDEDGDEEGSVEEDTNCDKCSDEATPWMQGRGVSCDTWPELKYRCNTNHWHNRYWSKNKFCQNSCYVLGKAHMYPGDNCCFNRGGDDGGDDSVIVTPAPNPVNECLADPCGDNGTCQDLVGGYSCTCNQGWSGINCDQDINECLINNGGCHANARCTNVEGGRTCSCKSGYFGNGINCSDHDECANDPCDPNATCFNTDGSFECRCNEGFTGNGIDECRQVDDCASNPCANGSCVDLIGDYRCDCLPGWTGRNCNENINDCSPNPCVNGQCTDRINGYSCSCFDGWIGEVCDVDVDECQGDPCHSNAMCTNTGGSFECQCKDGYEGDGLTCFDLNECAEEIDNCHPDAICTNLDGSFDCECKSGFSGDGVSCTKDTENPSASPSSNPSKDPSLSPSKNPTSTPSKDPTSSPTDVPSSPPSCSNECVQCQNIASKFMNETAPNAPVSCEGANEWHFLDTICTRPKNDTFIKGKYCQQACWDRGQRGYVNECNEPEECCPTPTPSPTEAASCLECDNNRTPYMETNNIDCETWGVNDFGAKCADTFQKDGNGDLRQQPFCRQSCYDRKTIIFDDAGGLPCCEPPLRPCIQCEDRTTTYMDSKGLACDTWNYITKERCDDPDFIFQLNNACRKWCSDTFNSIFYYEPCCNG